MTEILHAMVLRPLSVFGVTVSERPWILVGGILVGSYLLSRLVKWGGHTLLDRSGHGPDASFNRALFEEIHAPLYVSIALSGIYLSLSILDIVESSYYLVGTLLTVLVVLWMRSVVRLGNRWIELVNSTESEYEFSPVFKNLWTIFAVIGTGILLLSIWEIDVTPFLASAGVLGIILGLAAQEAIGNLIGGVALYFDNTYKTGDVIILKDGRRGTVTDIGIRSTTVLTRDNILVTVPNAVLNSASVVNESAPQRRKRIRVPITAAYGTDYQAVEQILLEVCDDVALILESPAPRVMFQEFGDSALIFELRAFVAHPFSEQRAVDQINRKVYDAFNEAGIVIPFPQRELSFLDAENDSLAEQRLNQVDNELEYPTEQSDNSED